MGIADDIKSIIQIKIKPRQDSYSDQFTRILLLKMMFVGALFTGMNWFDDLRCLIKNDADGAFSGSACWINGVYIYEDIRYHNNELGYYGMPRDISLDGKLPGGSLCESDTSATNTKLFKNKDCKPMKKTFFLQYQYMTFFLILMGAIYYAPYVFFKYVNTDIHSLKSTVKAANAQSIYGTFFNRAINPTSKSSLRVLGNILSKVLYIVANVVVFVLTDNLLHGNFKSYGTHYAKWSQLNNSLAYDYMGQRHSPKPGDILLPSFAFCEVYEMAEDVRGIYINKHRFICEMSQHILYQYIFILIWWAMVSGIAISVIGFIIQIANYVLTFGNAHNTIPGYSHLRITVRECEYLSYLQKKNLSLYGEILAILKAERGRGRVQDPRNPSAPAYNAKIGSKE